MPSFTNTAILALAATTAVSAYYPGSESYDTGLSARSLRVRQLQDTDAIADALVVREFEDHLDSLYARDLEVRHDQISDDFNTVFALQARENGINTRDAEEADAVFRLGQLARRDPELFELYRRGAISGALKGGLLGGLASKFTGGSFFGKGMLAGGAAGAFFGHESKKAKEQEQTEQSPQTGYDGPRRRSIYEDPELFYEY